MLWTVHVYRKSRALNLQIKGTWITILARALEAQGVQSCMQNLNSRVDIVGIHQQFTQLARPVKWCFPCFSISGQYAVGDASFACRNGTYPALKFVPLTHGPLEIPEHDVQLPLEVDYVYTHLHTCTVCVHICRCLNTQTWI